MTDRTAVGVLGVGSMGRNHARVFHELPAAELVGVTDSDQDRAEAVARTYDTRAVDVDGLLDAADAVSIVVPTRFHHEMALEAIEKGVHVLVEKPFVQRPEHGRELIARAQDLGVTLQVGHIERFNPAVRTLADIVPDLDLIAVDAMRLGPPVERDIDVNPVLDLMIHDIDVVRSFVDQDVVGVDARRSVDDPYATATVQFDGGVISRYAASRITQQKVRQLAVTARSCQILVDYIDQSVEIHRQSLPEYVEENGDVRFRHQSIVEHPTVNNGEPLKAELAAFIDAVRSGSKPVVTGEDGIEALQIANEIIDAAASVERRTPLEVGQ